MDTKSKPSVLFVFIYLLSLAAYASAGAWWQWLSTTANNQQQRFDNITSRLNKAYKEKLKPLEDEVQFDRFYPAKFLDDSDFNARPMVLLLGQYSTGKTTFIRYLLQTDFSGLEIGPEPSTDSFTILRYGEQEGSILGNVLTVEKSRSFQDLGRFGRKFLEHLKTSSLPNPVLESITLIDTPGILSGKKQRERGYDYEEVTAWFAERADMIILFFDVHKVDILEEFQMIIERIEKHNKKMLVVLNKADTITTPELIRVYGGLMWGLGRIITTPEVVRVYVGSFWDKPYDVDDNQKLFDEHRNQLFSEIQSLASLDVMRKVNNIIKRVHMVKTHAYIVSHLRDEMPYSVLSWQAKWDEAKEHLIFNLNTEFERIQSKHRLVRLDFPDVEEMQAKLRKHDFMELPGLSDIQGKLLGLEAMLDEDLHEIGKMLGEESTNEGKKIKSGLFTDCPKDSEHCHQQL